MKVKEVMHQLDITIDRGQALWGALNRRPPESEVELTPGEREIIEETIGRLYGVLVLPSKAPAEEGKSTARP